MSDTASSGFQSCFANATNAWSSSADAGDGAGDLFACIVAYMIDPENGIMSSKATTELETLDQCLVANDCLGFNGMRLDSNKLNECIGFASIVSFICLRSCVSLVMQST
jgi:hypothetical protein